MPHSSKRSTSTPRNRGGACYPSTNISIEGISGSRLDRPALDRLRDAAGRGEFDAVVVVSPDRLARNYAHQWLVVEELEKLQVQLIFLENPFGDSPQGKLLTQMQGMLAEYERAQILERTRRGRLDKARRGVYIPYGKKIETCSFSGGYEPAVSLYMACLLPLFRPYSRQI